jgi:hypothetical protein
MLSKVGVFVLREWGEPLKGALDGSTELLCDLGMSGDDSVWFLGKFARNLELT